MADIFKLKVQARKITGRKIKSLRREGILPANIFGKKIKSQSIQADYGEFEKLFAKAGETSIIELDLNGKISPVLVSNVHKDPVKGLFVHVDFHQVDLKEKVKAAVPVEITGEAPAEKDGKGVLVQLVNELEVEAFPMDLPESLTVDVSGLTDINAFVTVKDLKVDRSKVQIEMSDDEIVAKVEEIKEEVIEPVVTEAVVEEGAEGATPEGAEETKEVQDKDQKKDAPKE